MGIEEFRDPVEKSGLVDLLYVPPNNTLAYNQWPTLSEMILSGASAPQLRLIFHASYPVFCGFFCRQKGGAVCGL